MEFTQEEKRLLFKAWDENPKRKHFLRLLHWERWSPWRIKVLLDNLREGMKYESAFEEARDASKPK